MDIKVRWWAAVLMLGLLQGCGDGGGSDGDVEEPTPSTTDPTPDDPPQFTVGGMITGLEGATHTLLLIPVPPGVSFGQQEIVAGDGPFVFPDPIPDDAQYWVSIHTAAGEPEHGCTFINEVGLVQSANVTDVNIDCADRFSIGGEVRGLAGTGLRVSLATELTVGGVSDYQVFEDLELGANGAFTFDYELRRNEPYRVTIAQQPSDIDQECYVENAEDVAKADVDNIEIVCPTVLRKYRFDTTQTLGTVQGVRAGTVLDGVLHERLDYAYGGSPLGLKSGLDGAELFALDLDDPDAQSIIFSNETGFTYWLASESPPGIWSPDSETRIFTHYATLETYWKAIKLSADARFTLVFSQARALGYYDSARLVPRGTMLAGTEQAVRAYTYADETHTRLNPPFFSSGGGVFLRGSVTGTATVAWDIFDTAHAVADHVLWSADDFDLDPSAGIGTPSPDDLAYMSLREPVVVEIDLSGVPLGTEFVVVSETIVRANNFLSPEGSSAVFLRDPSAFEPGDLQGGATVSEMSGIRLLEITEVPGEADSWDTRPAQTCELPASERSTLAFDVAEYRIDEARESSRRFKVRVARTGPLTGVVTANVVIAAATAEQDLDYAVHELPVRFGDGSDEPRLIELDIIDDNLEEAEETLTLRLEGVAGCADAGEQDAAVVTIVDDDAPVGPGAFTLAGNVSGLAGSGLTLTNLSTDAVPISTNGAFAFSRQFPSGARYEVRVASQPLNPRQFCEVTNGSGLVTADVTDILVDCETLTEPAGVLDLTFGTGGRANAGAFPAGRAMTLQPDGRIVVAGFGRLGRFGSDGNLDPTFGTNGEAPVAFYSAALDKLNAVAVQADGRIVLAGYSNSGPTSPVWDDFVAARFLEDGSLDGTFDGDGQVITDFVSRADGGENVLLQPDGRIVVTGNALQLDAFGASDGDFAAVRYNVDGSLDTAFGGDGRVSVNVAGRSDIGYTSALQPDGKIVIAGRVANSGGANPDVGMARFNPDGSLDTTFGTAGVVREVTSDWDEVADMTLQPDGKLIVVGQADQAGVRQLLMARYNADGTADTSFGSDGRVFDSAITVGRAVALQADGGVVVAGDTAGDYVIARYTAQGQPDLTFGTNGAVTIDFFGSFDQPTAVAIQSDGRIVVAGSARNGTQYVLGLARIMP